MGKTSERTVDELRRAISKLSARGPETNRFKLAWSRRQSGQREQKAPWYRHQKEHWLGWLAEYGGPGFYARKRPHTAASFAYNHIVNPLMLVWLAEACGVPRTQRGRAVRAALRLGTMSAMAAALREEIPWTVVEGRLWPADR